MNIFATDRDTTICATYHTDIHTIKMPLEISQMVSFVYHNKDLWDKPIPQLLMSNSNTHDKHPCSLWIKENITNFMWACELGIKLVEEYRFRYNSNKHERCLLICQWSLQNIPDLEIDTMTPFAKTMPDEFKVDCSIQSYRNYYKFGKTDLHKWSKRDKPEWI